MEEGSSSMPNRPEATVVIFDHTPDADEGHGSGSSTTGRAEGIGNRKGSYHDTPILQINKEGNNDNTIVEDLNVGGSSVGDPVDKFESNQSTLGVTPRTAPFTSMDEYEAEMLRDLNTRTSRVLLDQIIELDPPPKTGK
ncbi:hypothetical protein BGW38_006121 [Lunasporangiospora selenospora]|uniref:Uncharacterized protein n=1 Tax=Lunasporangiospora selenospora TaxID=979761 RepID=A0A9P6KH79_9FUNG|nr:hypothetical protein BGW38_006121 [Lunasporangiospora selenospora]